VKKIPTALSYAVKFLFMCSVILVGCTSNNVTQDELLSGAQISIRQNIDVQSPTYVFQSGDLLRITVRGYPEFDTTTVISETGTITVRLVGEISAAGISRSQLVADLKSKLSVYVKTDIYPVITVLNALIQKVAVFGAVVRQENYTIGLEASLLQVLAMAGGTTAEADLQHLKIFRNGDRVHFEEVDFTKYISSGNIGGIPTVKPGDTVYVPREENIIRELSTFFRDTIFLFTLFTISN
jgi:polysaccharide biosynthesis/export protein